MANILIGHYFVILVWFWSEKYVAKRSKPQICTNLKMINVIGWNWNELGRKIENVMLTLELAHSREQKMKRLVFRALDNKGS